MALNENETKKKYLGVLWKHGICTKVNTTIQIGNILDRIWHSNLPIFDHNEASLLIITTNAAVADAAVVTVIMAGARK